MLTPRQELLLEKVVDGFAAAGVPVGSKALAADPVVDCGSSTVRNELAVLEELGLLAHPHTSAGRVPTDAGYRYYVDRLLSERQAPRAAALELELVRRQVDEAMRITTETLSEVTNLLAVVSAPRLDSTTIRHVEVLALQPHVLMVVVITSTGDVSKRLFTLDRPVDQGLADWAGSYFNEQLVGRGLGARTLRSRLADPTLGPTERAFVDTLVPAFTELADDAVFVDGTARLVSELRFEDVSGLNALMEMLERRMTMLEVVTQALDQRGTYVRIGHENHVPALQTLSLVAANYGLASRNLGTVSVIGPTRMDYGSAILCVREAASELSRFVEDLYAA